MKIWLPFFLILALFSAGCTRKIIPASPEMVTTFESADMSRLVLFYSAELETEHRLILEDSRIIYDKDNIKKICLAYSSQRLKTFCQARLELVQLVEGFLTRLNNHTALSFQVSEFPFPADNLEVTITYESYFGRYVDPLYVGLTCLRDGCAKYYAFDIKDIHADWSHQRFEPYFKSRELALIKQEADLPFTDRDRTPKRPNAFIYDRYFSPGS